MSAFLSITKYEYKMQIKRIAGWLTLFIIFIVSMADCLPVESNLARLEFLGDIKYYVRRVFSFYGLILLFAVFFLTAGCLAEDKKSHRRDLFMVMPIRKASYIGGKLLGNLFFALTLMYLLLFLSLCCFAIFSTSYTSFESYLSAVFGVSLCIILPATFFVIASSIMFSEIADIRFVYLVYSILFLVNTFSIDNAAEMRPFYIFTQGELSRLIWRHPKSINLYPIGICLNLLFMIGIGFLAIVLVATKKRFWRNE